MPIVTIALIEGRTKEQKARIVEEITDTLVRMEGISSVSSLTNIINIRST